MATFQDQNKVHASTSYKGQENGYSVPQQQYLTQDIHPLSEEEYNQSTGKRPHDNLKGSVSTETNINDLQMIYDSQIGQFISIHEHESNIVRCDSMKYIDRNFYQTIEFTTLSAKTIEEPEKQKPWNNFWNRK